MAQNLRQESGDVVEKSSPICSGLISHCADWQVFTEQSWLVSELKVKNASRG
jgi:hypothetical protein